MVEPVTILGAVWVSKDVAKKLLGPTAEYIGDKLLGLTQKCDVNLGDIFAKAYRKLAGRTGEPGPVDPRVFGEVINSGRFCENDVVMEYYAGMLAGTSLENMGSDQAFENLSLLRQMASCSVALHAVIYLSIRRIVLS